MGLTCENIKLQKGSQGTNVKELQTILKNKGYYAGKIDGDYGNFTVEAVKQYQKDNGLSVDGWVGPITCKKLNTNTNSSSGDTTGIYTSRNHHEGAGCNKRGQCNKTCCGPHSIRQSNSKQDIDQFYESNISGWAGTTSNGTSHMGIQTALYEVARRSGRKINIEWKNFSDMGKTTSERFRNIGKLIEKQNISVIWHVLYRNKWGHYEVVKQVNMNNNSLIVLNSLGNGCGNGSYCGYLETRSFNTMIQYLNGISQKSLAIITYE
ncbi:MAG: hypothetical protein BZ136_07475 [Methanosphaera sp. rholeuAM74]|nr:MAG: hypothetical protein BZ136_07475 [Methanosphaera sp. rholeuAM74]